MKNENRRRRQSMRRISLSGGRFVFFVIRIIQKAVEAK